MSFTLKHCSIGGQIQAKVQRQKAIENYNANPNICKRCKAVIPIPEGAKVAIIRQKQFCSQTCSAIYNNQNRERRLLTCIDCNGNFRLANSSRRKLCPDCLNARSQKIANTQKGQTDRRVIYNHAQIVMKSVPRICQICKYDKHAEICHIKPISSFEPTALLSEINAKENLVILCPNHHWELDHKMLKL